MSDHDLALAAKAAGKSRAEWDYDWLMAHGNEVARDMLWDPRRDSGQALELAVKLHMNIGTNADGGGFADSLDGLNYAEFEDDGGDQCAEMRLAIFKVAVKIGRAMP